jgi:peptidoglycan LD-endopeptidase LytH
MKFKRPSNILPYPLSTENILKIDLSEQATQNIEIKDTASLNDFILNQIKQNGKICAVGGYLEKRNLYQRSPVFDKEGGDRRIHLGIDIWAEAGTGIFSPFDAKIHSFKNNHHFGDYGPTIILEHREKGNVFYTLYGHLSLSSLENKTIRQSIGKNEKFATIGEFPENGDWPPHLHFQVILDMNGFVGDFPGVCSEADLPYYSKLCPDPSGLLGIA